jgi:hypothetical protein
MNARTEHLLTDLYADYTAAYGSTVSNDPRQYLRERGENTASHPTVSYPLPNGARLLGY